jgi:hypothetical protein
VFQKNSSLLNIFWRGKLSSIFHLNSVGQPVLERKGKEGRKFGEQKPHRLPSESPVTGPLTNPK